VAGAQDAVSAEDLWRSYGRQRVLRGLSLAVPSGRCLAILGPNGSGKTTLLRVLGAALRPRSGRVRIHGGDPFVEPAARRRIGFVGHEPMLYGGLSVLENLRLLATLYDLSDGPARAAQICDLLGIDRPTVLVRNLSRGSQQRTALARALLHRPAVLLLDEPSTGLDLAGAEVLWRILRDFCRDGGATVMTTHSAVEALRVADTAAVLSGGRLSAPAALAGMDAEALRSWYASAGGGGDR
jgi:heme ABC exporter ATP-binding subunit CcmA